MDDYHFTKDPATLRDARLTKDEAEVISNYRQATAQLGPGRRIAYVAVPISDEFADDETLVRLQRAAHRAIVKELGSPAAPIEGRTP